MNKTTLTSAQLTAAEVNGGSTVTLADALLIVQYCMNKISSL
jgi:hypothetical protein